MLYTIEYTPRYEWSKALMLELLATQEEYYIQCRTPDRLELDMNLICGKAQRYMLSEQPGVMYIEVDIFDKTTQDILNDFHVDLNMCARLSNSGNKLVSFYFALREENNND